MNLKRKIKGIVILLCASVLLVLGIFYMYTARSLRLSNEQGMQQISEQIIDYLESELLGLESMAFAIGQNDMVHGFLLETDAVQYHVKSAVVDELIRTLNHTGTNISGLLLVGTDGIYSRFIGQLGNTASSRIVNLLSSADLPSYFAISLEGISYIGYAAGAYQENMLVGTVVLLIEENQLLGLFEQYDANQSLCISMVSNGVVITSSDDRLSSLSVEQMLNRSALFLGRTIGFAPFEIYVTVENGYLWPVYAEFLFAALVTTIIFICLFLVFTKVANRHFFKPILSIMDDVESLGVSHDFGELKKTGEEDFDNLVDQMNRMLARLDEKNKALLGAKTELQTAELERQRSLIISLKKQINAHFTVNVLNIIKVLIAQGEMEKAREMSDGLSQLLRYANAGDEFINGMEEFFVLRKYVSIMEIRYKNRFATVFDWDDQMIDIQMPRMLVQPLIENAILHGLASDEGVICISGKVVEDNVMIQVADNGRGMDSKQLDGLKERLNYVQSPAWGVAGISNIALENIQRRIWSYYGVQSTVGIDSENGKGTCVTISFPTHCKVV